MSLLDLAIELLLTVVESFDKLGDINALARTNQRLRFLLNGYLYHIDVHQRGRSALFWAVEHGLEGTARLSLAAGADCEATGRGHPPLIGIIPDIFYRRHRVERCRGFYVDEDRSTIGLTPLQLAVGYGHDFVARLLIEHGADIKKAYPEVMARCTLVHLASAHGLSATVQLLLHKGAKLEARDVHGQTPLHYAAKPNNFRPRGRKNVEIVKYLLEKGAKYSTRDTCGQRPEDLVKVGLDSLNCRTLWGRRDERGREDDHWAERRIRQLLEAKRVEQFVQKLDRDRESSRKKRIASEKALRERLVDRKRDNDRLREEAQRKQEKEELRKRAEETEAVQKEAKETEARKRAEEARLAEISLRELQEAARNNWSQLKEQAEQRRTCNAMSPSRCTHSSIAWLKNKARGQCQLCERICTKYSFQCPDCGCVACTQCKLQYCLASVRI